MRGNGMPDQPLTEQQAASILGALQPGDQRSSVSVGRLRCALPFDRDRLQAAVAATVADDARLRTVLDLRSGGIGWRTIESDCPCELRVVDLSGMDPTAQVRMLADELCLALGQGFDLMTCPWLRVAAFPLHEEAFALDLITHPALVGRSAQRDLLADILARYQGSDPKARSEAQPSPASGPERDGITFARWSEALDGGAAPPTFWAAGLPPDDDRPTVLEIDVPPALCAALDALAARCGLRLEMVLLAASAKAVSLATGRESVTAAIDVPDPLEPAADDRARALTAALRLSAGSWDGFASATSATVAESRRFADYPPERLSRVLGLDHLLDLWFTYSEASIESDCLDGPAGRLQRLAGGAGAGHWPFRATLLVEFFRGPATGRMALRLTAGDGLAGGQLAEYLRIQMDALAHSVTGAPHHSLSAITEDQRRLLLHGWSGEQRPYADSRPVHELIAAQAARTPGALAVLTPTTALTYAELDTRANSLAGTLRSRGVVVGSVVAVCTRRDEGMLIAFLGVLKAGAAYLPLDPGQPRERVTYMLDDSGAELVLTDGRYASTVPPGPWAVLDLDVDTGPDLHDHAAGVSSPVGLDDLMYVIYTSGSTGAPKGVQVPHRGVVNYLWWCVEAYLGSASGGAPVFSSVAFDMVVPNLYAPLLVGQRVCILPEETDLLSLGECLDTWAPFAFIKLTPGQLDTVGALIGPDVAERLTKTLAVGADAFSTEALRRWRRLDSGSVVLNEYGPTEASVGNCVHFVDGHETAELVPIGRPIPNTTMYVLDVNGDLVPPGVPGELYIGGACVARGYVNQPALTAERFLPDPFAADPDARMYRTGDIGRWLVTGALDFMGRRDDQVKIRG